MTKIDKRLVAIISLGAIFIFALGLRLYPVIMYPETLRYGMGEFGDSFVYNDIAFHLYKFKGFSCSDEASVIPDEKAAFKPAITRGPGYPFFLFLVYRLFGSENSMDKLSWYQNWNKVRIAQCFLDAVICLLVFAIVRCIYPASFLPALISAILYCFSFYNIYYTRTLLSESLATFLLTLSIFSYIRSLKQDSRIWLISSGICFGLTILTRPEYLLLPLALTLPIYLSHRQDLTLAVKKSILFMASAIIIVAPWTLRNYIVFKKIIPVSTGSLGYSLYLGTFEGNQQWLGWGHLPEDVMSDNENREKLMALYKKWDDGMYAGGIGVKEADAKFMNLAIERIRKNFFLCSKSWFKSAPRLWYQNYIPMYLEKEASGGFFLFYFFFALYGLLIVQRKEKILIAAVFITFVYMVVIFFPLHIEPRYSVSLMPFFIFIAGIGLCKFWRYLKERF